MHRWPSGRLQVNYDEDVLCNYVRGRSIPLVHVYQREKKSATEPWLAFFTGGDRLTKRSGPLNNNNHGRFRLEVTPNPLLSAGPVPFAASLSALRFTRPSLPPQVSINVQGKNRSPVVSMLPVLPVPYMGREYRTQHGYMSTFQISAFDPDAHDTVTFHVASWEKHGALMGNSIPEGTYPGNWYKVGDPLAPKVGIQAQSARGFPPVMESDSNLVSESLRCWVAVFGASPPPDLPADASRKGTRQSSWRP